MPSSNSIPETLLDSMKTALGGSFLGISSFRDDVTAHVAKDAVAQAALWLRDNPICPFRICEDLFGIDQFRDVDRFEMKYTFYSPVVKARLHLKAAVDESDPHIPSIVPVFPSANFAEREAYDMFGIEFDAHPDLRRMYMPEDYEYYPLRKDFPLMGIPDSIPLPKR